MSGTSPFAPAARPLARRACPQHPADTQTADARSPGVVQTHTLTTTYNANDWPTSTSDDGLGTAYGYDAAAQRRSETILDPTAIATTLDAAGRSTAISESAGGTGPYTTGYS